jgi:hypothetical protein
MLHNFLTYYFFILFSQIIALYVTILVSSRNKIRKFFAWKNQIYGKLYGDERKKGRRINDYSVSSDNQTL